MSRKLKLVKEKPMDIAQVEAFFFKAMVEGYVVGGKKIKIPDMPGYKAVSFRDEDFYLLDRWCEIPNSPMSAGTTTIWFKDVPAWVMNYGGWYHETAIPFLKHALSNTYNINKFVGGRGPLTYTEKSSSGNSLLYVNYPRLNNFNKFEGREEVFFNAESGVSLGFHEYWGMSLL